MQVAYGPILAHGGGVGNGTQTGPIPPGTARRLVVVKGDGEVIEEGEDLVLLREEPLEQVASRRLRYPTALARSTLTSRRGMGGEASGQERVVPSYEHGALA